MLLRGYTQTSQLDFRRLRHKHVLEFTKPSIQIGTDKEFLSLTIVQYENTLPNTPLRLFAARWARWRCTSQPTLWESSHNRELQHDRRGRGRHTTNQTVSDPRVFKIEHWYSECSRTERMCNHATVQTRSNSTTNPRETLDFPRVWSKRERHKHFTKAKTLLTAFFVAYGSTLSSTLSFVTLIIAVLIAIVVVSVTCCHCGPCSGCHGCVPCRWCRCCRCPR